MNTALDRLNEKLDEFVQELKAKRARSFLLLEKHANVFAKSDYDTLKEVINKGINVTKVKKINELLETLERLSQQNK